LSSHPRGDDGAVPRFAAAAPRCPGARQADRGKVSSFQHLGHGLQPPWLATRATRPLTRAACQGDRRAASLGVGGEPPPLQGRLGRAAACAPSREARDTAHQLLHQREGALLQASFARSWAPAASAAAFAAVSAESCRCDGIPQCTNRWVTITLSHPFHPRSQVLCPSTTASSD
jgi:hypothetical protein